jgi:hypothetical protein
MDSSTNIAAEPELMENTWVSLSGIEASTAIMLGYKSRSYSTHWRHHPSSLNQPILQSLHIHQTIQFSYHNPALFRRFEPSRCTLRVFSLYLFSPCLLWQPLLTSKPAKVLPQWEVLLQQR